MTGVRKKSAQPETRNPKPDTWEAIDQARQARAFVNLRATPPEGSFTVNQYAARYGLSREGAYGQIQSMLDQGTFKCVGSFGSKSAKHYQIAG